MDKLNAEKIKKNRERFMFDRFVEASKLPVNLLEHRDAPDFLVNLNDKTIGIELTEIFIEHAADSGQSLQAHETLGDKIVRRAKELYREISTQPIHVTMNFSPSANMRDIQRDELAKQIADFLHNAPLKDGLVFEYRPAEYEDLPLAEEVSFIHARRVPEDSMAHWAVARAGWVATLPPERLQSRIDEKARKLDEYRKAAPENWLVVICDRTKPSQALAMPSDFARHLIKSPFDRTFYYTYPEMGLIKLGAPPA